MQTEEERACGQLNPASVGGEDFLIRSVPDVVCTKEEHSNCTTLCACCCVPQAIQRHFACHMPKRDCGLRSSINTDRLSCT